MAKVSIKISGLIPDERYRMVITPKEDAITKFNAPSIGFNVPKASTRLDTYKVYVSAIADTNIPAGSLTAGTDQVIQHPSVLSSGSISYWVANYGSYDYSFTVNDSSTIKAGDHFWVDDISTPPDEYYDQLYYTVTSAGGNIVNVRASYRPDIFRTFLGSTAGWDFRDGRALSNKNNANAATWTNQTPAYTSTVTGTTTTTIYGKFATIRLTDPLKNLMWTNTVKDIPVFMFEFNNKFYYLSNQLKSDTTTAERAKSMWGKYSDTAVVDEVTSGGPLQYDPSNAILTATTPPLSAVHYLGTENIRPKYYFTIARYTKDSDGINWVGNWLQKKVGYDLNPTIENVVKGSES